MKAVWKGTIIAESDDTVVVEGNHYFPAEAVKAARIAGRVAFWKGVSIQP